MELQFIQHFVDFFFKKNPASKDGVLFVIKRWLEESELEELAFSTVILAYF